MILFFANSEHCASLDTSYTFFVSNSCNSFRIRSEIQSRLTVRFCEPSYLVSGLVELDHKLLVLRYKTRIHRSFLGICPFAVAVSVPASVFLYNGVIQVCLCAPRLFNQVFAIFHQHTYTT